MTAGSGEEALERFGEQAEQVDLVVSDVVMSGIDGVELVRRFAALNPAVRRSS